MLTCLVPVLLTFCIQCVLKLKKNNSGAKRLTSVDCKQMERVMVGNLRQVWDTNKSLHEGQHGFRPGSLCESHIVTFCQDIADSLEESYDRRDNN